GRSSAAAHAARKVDLPWPAGAVTATRRQAPERAVSARSPRLTVPGRGRGTENLASSSSWLNSGRGEASCTPVFTDRPSSAHERASCSREAGGHPRQLQTSPPPLVNGPLQASPPQAVPTSP